MRVILTIAGISLLVGCSDEDEGGVGDSCANNTDCADAICHSGICVSKNPLKNGDPCDNSGYCRSLNCFEGTCEQNSLADGSTCLNDEECQSDSCGGGICGGVDKPDAAARADGGGSKCEPGFTECRGTCVDTQTDPQHCGKCDNPCPGGADAECVGGKCL
jgi:hypothetical protein